VLERKKPSDAISVNDFVVLMDDDGILDMRVIDFFDRGADRFADRTFLIDADGSRTYRDSQRMSHRLAAALLHHGLNAGDKAAVYSPNSAAAFECVLGILRAGGVWVPVNARNSAEENSRMLHVFDVRVLFFHSSLEPEVRAIKETCAAIEKFVCIDANVAFAPSVDNWISVEPADRFVDLPEDSNGPIAIFPTGGTTGTPKGVMWGTRQFEAQIANFLLAMPPRKTPVHLVTAPLTHAAGVFTLLLSAVGATHIVLTRAEPQLILEAIQREQVTHLYLPPTVIYMLLGHPGVKNFNFSSLEYFMYGGAPMSVEKLKDAVETFGPVMAQTYGQMEAPGFCTYLSPADHVASLKARPERLASCGRPTMFTFVNIMDDNGNLLRAGEIGEIVVRGALVMQGYYRNPEATAAVSQYGWHHTGDLGYWDEDGYFYLVDRKRDLIITGGFNVYPGEVEQVIWSHEDVQDCAVVGVPDEKWGEAVKAIVELKPGAAVAEAELIALCKERLGGVKAPKSIEFWPTLPRTSAGKVRKKDIRERFWIDQKRKI
jgi:acyl-CoA synthetase (AMP-forming)/AMP-acid ligase II